MIVSANEVKMKGVSLFGKLLSKADELIINVRGKNKYVVLDIERYQEFRQMELDLAHRKVMEDLQAGRFQEQSSAQHIKELKRVVSPFHKG